MQPLSGPQDVSSSSSRGPKGGAEKTASCVNGIQLPDEYAVVASPIQIFAAESEVQELAIAPGSGGIVFADESGFGYIYSIGKGFRFLDGCPMCRA